MIRQKTGAGCLAVCLLKLLDKKVSFKKELEILIYAFGFYKEDFAIGHLNFIAENLEKELEYYVDNLRFLEVLKKISFSKRINLTQRKIDLRLISRLIEFSPVIVYVDDFYINQDMHYPHFVIVLKKEGKDFQIFDPWDGKVKLIKKEKLSRAIKSLRNLLKFCPKIICVKL